jgi:hypothetical protein
MQFEECVAVIYAFKSQYPNVVLSKNAHGLEVTFENGQPVVQLVVTGIIEESQLLADEIMPESFTYISNGSEQTILSRVIKRGIPSAQGQMGRPSHGVTSGKKSDLTGYGTVGWNFLLNGRMTCMSNWHVFCPDGNATPYGTSIFISDTTSIWDAEIQANLSAFQNISEGGLNTWDYALAEYIKQPDFQKEFRYCADETTKYPYPSKGLSKNVVIGDGAIYRKVGAREPVCRTGTLTSVGDATVNYGTNEKPKLIKFSNQLIFSPMCFAGDSGSIIVRTDDNTVTGLLFAGPSGSPYKDAAEAEEDKSKPTIANPIYRIGWSFQGFFTFENGSQVASFTGNPIPPSLDRKNLNDSFDANIPTLTPALFDGFNAGKLFLGEAIAELDLNNSITRWVTPPPPPFRDVEVETVIISCSERYIDDGQAEPRPGPNPDVRPSLSIARRVYVGSTCKYLCFG